jgi:phosphatidylglycerophosphatase A
VLGTWFGSGFSPLASGTAGTAATLPLVAVLALRLPYLDVFSTPWSPWCLVAAALLFYPGVLAGTAIEEATLKHDDGKIVVDETVGTLLTFAFVPEVRMSDPRIYLAGFLLFRVIDVWKPWIIGYSQALPRGWGVMMDDVLGGLLAGAILTAGVLWLMAPA